MFSPKTYHCICHGCGALHEYRAGFLSVPLLFGVNLPDGTQLALPCLGCADCRAVTTERREEHPIARAFAHGMTADACARAEREVTARVARDGRFWESQS